jgi:predicted LPLAT superfamily acyltransferase
MSQSPAPVSDSQHDSEQHLSRQSAPEQSNALRACVVIPVYDHPATIAGVCAGLAPLGLPIVLVDDGCSAPCAEVLDQLAAEGHHLVRRTHNGGKGAAVRSGLQAAEQLGFTHALQVDADGQHDVSDLPAFLKGMQDNPDCLQIGYPEYDASVPRIRFYGRYASHVWVWINTLSLAIRDTMCGVRLYPLAATNRLLARNDCGDRMSFDTEVLVRWYWAGGEVANLPVRVSYPTGGVSHFRPGHDNLLISAMHTRLFCGMLLRSPTLAWRTLSRRGGKRQTAHAQDDALTDGEDRAAQTADDSVAPNHWARLSETGSLSGMRLMVTIRRRLGAWPFRIALFPVLMWYFLLRGVARRASFDYLRRLEPGLGGVRLWARSFAHFMQFGEAIMDKVSAWSGEIPLSSLTGTGPEDLRDAALRGEGGIILVAHHGNLDVINAIGERHDIDLCALVHTRHAEKFNQLLEQATGRKPPQMIEVSEITPATAMALGDRVNRGGFVVIAADRVPIPPESVAAERENAGGSERESVEQSAVTRARVQHCDFIDQPAPFPVGPFMLAALLRCHVYTLSCVREQGGANPRFRVDFAPFDDSRAVKRSTREAWIEQAMQRHAGHLEARVRRHPLQWFNFFDFWHQAPDVPTSSEGASESERVT